MTGQWVTRRGGVKVFVETPERPRTLDLTRLIACPTCHAKVTETCRTSGGNPTAPHGSRLAPRLCPCGALLEPKKQLCEHCRVESRRLSWRLREQRRKTSQRRREVAA